MITKENRTKLLNKIGSMSIAEKKCTGPYKLEDRRTFVFHSTKSGKNRGFCYSILIIGDGEETKEFVGPFDTKEEVREEIRAFNLRHWNILEKSLSQGFEPVLI